MRSAYYVTCSTLCQIVTDLTSLTLRKNMSHSIIRFLSDNKTQNLSNFTAIIYLSEGSAIDFGTVMMMSRKGRTK